MALTPEYWLLPSFGEVASVHDVPVHPSTSVCPLLTPPVTPPVQHCVAEEQATPLRTSPEVFAASGEPTMFHVVPAHSSTSVLLIPLASAAEPTAQHSVAEAHVTPLRVFDKVAPVLGDAATVH